MKSRSEILSRLKKLRLRYLKKYLKDTQSRVHHNCVYNVEHRPKRLLTSPIETDLTISPRRTNSLVVIQSRNPPDPVHICTYGTSDGAWNGDLCDKDNGVVKHCKFFTPRIPCGDAEKKFNDLISDDEYVADVYPDMAVLQWVLGRRMWSTDMSFIEKIRYAISKFFIMRNAYHINNLPPSLEILSLQSNDPLERLWDDDDTEQNSQP